MFKTHRPIFFKFLFICLFCQSVRSQVGDSCKLPVTRKPGICKLVTQCPSAYEQHVAGINPTVCGRYYNEPIVCCYDENTRDDSDDNFAVNLNSDFESESDDSQFVFPGSTVVSRKRISEQKCIEYSRLLVQVVLAIPLVTNPKPITAEIPKCDYSSIPLIVGGAPAEPGEFPHMALLGYRNPDNEIEWNCGATLISEKFVLTAAHCTYTRNGQPVLVRLGELDLSRNDDGAQPKNFNVAQVIRHEGYKSPEKYNDIGLVRLRQSVKFNRFMRPACLWTKFNLNQNKTIAIGWGHTEFAGHRSDILQKVALDIIDKNQCNSYYIDNNRFLPRGIQSSMLCAGSLKGDKDTCQGDSGGPILITSPDNQCLFYIIGITSFGKGCGGANTAAIYTRVSEYIPWIENIVWS